MRAKSAHSSFGGALPASPNGNIEIIQYLRGIAAVLVVYYHGLNYIKGDVHLPKIGAEGVDIFFVISGFIMAYTVSQSASGFGSFSSSLDFFKRRGIRVVPLYWLALLIAWQKDIRQGGLDWLIIKDFIFIAQWHPIQVWQIWPKLIPGWTINYEMFFYLIFGGALLAGRWAFHLTIITIFSLAGFGLLFASQESSSALFRFYTSPILLEFAYGIILFFIFRLFRASGSMPLLYLGALVSGIYLFLPGDSIRAFSDGLPAALMVGCLLMAGEVRVVPFLRLLGDASYSIYLFHVIGLQFADKIFNLTSSVFRYEYELPVFALRILIALTFGILMHFVVEKPMMVAFRRNGASKMVSAMLGLLRRLSVGSHSRGGVIAGKVFHQPKSYSLSAFSERQSDVAMKHLESSFSARPLRVQSTTVKFGDVKSAFSVPRADIAAW